MSFLSPALARVKPSPTVAMTTRALALKEAGREVIALAAGEPDMPTPQHIREAAKAAIDRGETRYTAVDGIAPLKRAVAEKFARENGLDVGPGQVSVGTGGKQVLYNALIATVGPGDEVVIPAPYWVSYPDIVLLAGGTPVVVTPAEGFKITPPELEAALTPRTKWVILNSPSNPTGAAYTEAELRALADVLLRHPRVWVLSDDIYEHLTYDGFAFRTIAQVEPGLASRTLTVNGVSKAYAMTGWRLGYGAGPAPLIAAMATVQSQSTSNPCSISQWAALAALTGPQDHLEPQRAVFDRRRRMVVERLNAIPGIDCPMPEGAFYVYPSVAGLIGRTTRGGTVLATDEDVALALLDETGVALVHGGAFGLSPALRLSYAAADDQLVTALDRIGDFVAGLA